MQAKGFFSSLFDYSFSSYITPRIIKVLYVLATVIVALWTLLIILAAFRASSGLGIVTLLIIGPICFVIAMIWARVGLEALSAFFRIHQDVHEINQRADRGGETSEVATAAEPSSEAVPSESEPATRSRAARFCENCGAERSPGKRFCPSCGEPFE
jgi:hypothetical protein